MNYFVLSVYAVMPSVLFCFYLLNIYACFFSYITSLTRISCIILSTSSANEHPYLNSQNRREYFHHFTVEYITWRIFGDIISKVHWILFYCLPAFSFFRWTIMCQFSVLWLLLKSSLILILCSFTMKYLVMISSAIFLFHL